MTTLSDLLTRATSPAGPPSEVGPDAVDVRPCSLRVGDGVCATLAVTGYPAEVGLGWLEPLVTDPGRLDVAVHIEPIPPPVAADRLRHQLARLESTSRADAARGRLADYQAEAATDDAHQLAAALARGESRLFRAGLYITVHARDDEELDAEYGRVRALCASLLLDAHPTTFRSLQGWATTLPLGHDALRMRRAMDTDALAASFPFTSPDLPAATGDTAVLYGANTASSSLVTWDRWTQDNYNSVILARSGAGKSYLAKLELLRLAYAGVEAAVIDPEDEYTRLCDAVGGAHIPLGASGVRLNPFDLPPGARHTSDALTRRALFCHTLISVMVGEVLDPAARAALDRAVIATYGQAGITHDPRTWSRPAPHLANLADTLDSDDDPNARELAARLAPYVTGSYRGLFDGPTTTRPEGHLVVFSLRDLPDELKTVGTLLALDAVWRRITNPVDRRKRLVVVDEGWLLMRETEGARFLFRMAKASRKHWAGLTVVTQDAADVLGSDLGQAVVANAATQILLRQAPQAIEAISEAFHLTDGERRFLLSAERGEGLLAAGSSRVSFHALASDTEDQLVTTDPEFIASLEQSEEDEP